jgi:hypothetical protein
LNGLCPDLLDIHPGEQSTSKGLQLLVIGRYLGFQPFLTGFFLDFQAFHNLFLAGQQEFQYLFHLASVLLTQSYPLQLIWSIQSNL